MLLFAEGVVKNTALYPDTDYTATPWLNTVSDSRTFLEVKKALK